nr:hypothetical protein [Tanacetum cinerariifolium]
MLDSRGFITLMTPTQALISIQVMADHSHNWYDETTIIENAIQESFKEARLTKECPLKKVDKEVHITLPDDDYVALATNPILDKQLDEFRKECFDITRVSEKVNGNPVKDVQEHSDIKTYDCETFIRKILHQVSQSSHDTGLAARM